jgi:hypothetical protein
MLDNSWFRLVVTPMCLKAVRPVTKRTGNH